MKKIASLIIVNLFFLALLWFVFDVVIFYSFLHKFQNTEKYYNPKFYSKPYNPIDSLNWFFSEPYDNYHARKPLEIKNSMPIILFGCSFAYGEYLPEDKTFGYKLYSILKRTVYNRAMYGAGFQQMYYLSLNDKFCKNVPKSATVIYVLIDDHFRRMLGDANNICDDYLSLHYSYRNGEFFMDNYENPIILFLKRNYTIRFIQKIFYKYYLSSPKYADKITDEALAYFVKTRENLEKKWKCKIVFIVLKYEQGVLTDKLVEKLKLNDFIVVDAEYLVGKVLNDDEYKSKENNHPNEAAWDLLTSLFVQNLQSRNIF